MSTPSATSDQTAEEPDDDTPVAEIIQGYSDELDKRCHERFLMGERKYGPGTWMKLDTLEMAIEELIDLMNYGRFTYIRLRCMQEMLKTDNSTAQPLPGMEMLGKDAFISSERQ